MRSPVKDREQSSGEMPNTINPQCESIHDTFRLGRRQADVHLSMVGSVEQCQKPSKTRCSIVNVGVLLTFWKRLIMLIIISLYSMIATSRTGSQPGFWRYSVGENSKQTSGIRSLSAYLWKILGWSWLYVLFPGKAFWGFENMTRKTMHFQHENCLTMTARKQAVAATDLLCIVPWILRHRHRHNGIIQRVFKLKPLTCKQLSPQPTVKV